MSNEARWRLAAPSDDPALIAMVHELYVEDPSDKPVPREHTERTLAALRRDPNRGRVAILDASGVPSGYAFLISFWSNELGGELVEIDELYVAQPLRGMGYASLLIRSLRDGTGPWPAIPVALALQVTPSNVRARRLYERLGFSELKNRMLVARISPAT